MHGFSVDYHWSFNTVQSKNLRYLYGYIDYGLINFVMLDIVTMGIVYIYIVLFMYVYLY